jgi:hemerythrin-like metal-binding protein
MASIQVYETSNDEDHKTIATIGDELGQLLSGQALDRNRVAYALNMLKASMLLHFSHEEAMMKQNNYPNLFHHKRSHDYIMSILSEFISAFAVGRESTTADLWPHLQKTLDTHLQRYDADFAAYLGQAS